MGILLNDEDVRVLRMYVDAVFGALNADVREEIVASRALARAVNAVLTREVN